MYILLKCHGSQQAEEGEGQEAEEEEEQEGEEEEESAAQQTLCV